MMEVDKNKSPRYALMIILNDLVEIFHYLDLTTSSKIGP